MICIIHLVKRLGENDNSKKVRFNRNIRLNGVRPVATEPQVTTDIIGTLYINNIVWLICIGATAG